MTIYQTNVKTRKKRRGFLNALLSENIEPKSAITMDKIQPMLRQIENIAQPDKCTLNIIVHTMGGDSLACELLAKAIINFEGTVRVFIPQYAFSAGTIIALTGDEIYMGKNAVLGPVDAQIMGLPLNSILDSLKENQDQKGILPSFVNSIGNKIKKMTIDYIRFLESNNSNFDLIIVQFSRLLFIVELNGSNLTRASSYNEAIYFENHLYHDLLYYNMKDNCTFYSLLFPLLSHNYHMFLLYRIHLLLSILYLNNNLLNVLNAL